MWKAEFLAGHVQGDTVYFGANEVTPALYKYLRKQCLAQSWFSKANKPSNKVAAKQYIVIWCQAIHDGTISEHTAMFHDLLTAAPKAATNPTESAADDDTADGKSDGADGELSGEETAVVGAVERE